MRGLRSGICSLLVLTGLALFSGCASFSSKEPEAPPPQAQGEGKVEPKAANTGDGMCRSLFAYPTGDRATSIVIMEKSIPCQVVVGQEFEYELAVTNMTSTLNADDVVITDATPSNFKFISASPAPTSTDGQLKWNIARLNPKEVRKIKVKGQATAPGDLTQCGQLTCVPKACVTIAVVAPALKLTESAPAEVMICDVIPVRLVVSNSGSGSATNVKVNANLPTGLTTTDGKSTVAIDAGTLAPGQSKEFTVNTKASKTGKFDEPSTASADGGLKAEATASTTVREPVLVVTKTGPEKTFISRNFVHEVTVSNKGDGVAKNTVLTDTPPVGARFVSATDGGSLQDGKLIWSVGDLAPNATKKVSVTFMADAAGVLEDCVTASAVCAKPVTACAKTTVTGIPAILLEVVDDPDPIQIGTDVVYTITVTNQGSAADTNIKIVSTLEDTMTFVSTTGPTKGTAEGATVTFDPLPTLAPKAKVSWTVRIKAAKVGDVRFKVNMTTDRLTRPVEETESTNFYQ